MLGVKHETEVEQVRLVLGKALVRAQDAQKVLRRRQFGARVVYVQTAVAEVVFVDRVGLTGDDGQPRRDFDALTEHVLKRRGVRILVVGVERENAGRNFVHERAAGCFHENVLGVAGRQTTVGVKQRVELRKLRLGWQLTEKQQIDALLKAVPTLRRVALDQLRHVVAAVFELALVGHLFALVDDVAVRVAYARDAGCDAGAVGLTQTALDAIAVECAAGYTV